MRKWRISSPSFICKKISTSFHALHKIKYVNEVGVTDPWFMILLSLGFFDAHKLASKIKLVHES